MMKLLIENVFLHVEIISDVTYYNNLIDLSLVFFFAIYTYSSIIILNVIIILNSLFILQIDFVNLT